MAVRLKLGSYEPVESDPLDRSSIGYFPRMTEAEAWEAGRGVWRMSTEKIGRQKFALIVAEGRVRAVGEITGFTVHDDRVALEGRPLAEGHPVRDAYLGKKDPVATGSQNPVGYCDLPEEQQFVQRACGCGCGQLSDRDFLPGHDVRAMQQYVRTYFDASPRKFLDWVDGQLTAAASLGGRHKWPGNLMSPEMFNEDGRLKWPEPATTDNANGENRRKASSAGTEVTHGQ
ncbi:hypothetical protein L3Q65_00390 (plasmid) [Amycolatopsis sp. FU40]|uniref:hypothetical protein n=1 Tax=Amycolatopsis sp. FU40 TaxID=2914159 RepID=UPI001F45501B|nr:hypothetical protein [Amycolatopsis sp. FU40]UKD50787.1 hypothetical protein L3Q65_00390 [Amycolatopsis sp. FU40]